MSFKNRILSYIVEPDEEGEVGSITVPEPETDTAGEPGLLTKILNLKPIQPADPNTPVVDSQGAALSGQVSGQEESVSSTVPEPEADKPGKTGVLAKVLNLRPVLPVPKDNPENATSHGQLPEKNSSPAPSFFTKFMTVFSKPPETVITSVLFDPGTLDTPSLEGALKDVNMTYVVEQPYQYVHIEYVRQEGALIYSVVEPQLSEEEVTALRIIENAFEKLVSTNVELIDAEQRENYLHDRFYSLIHIFGLKLSDAQKQRMFFHLRKNYLGYGRIDTLMKDKYIEDISCNGSNMNIYVQHRTYGSIRTNVQFAEVELNNFVLKLAQVSGRHVSLLQPIRDLTLPDGSRANITLGSEVTKRGSTFTIRKFRANPISSIELMDYGSIDAQQLAYTWILMEYKRSILVSGGTATGKTTFLNVLCSFIPPEYKIVSIEDTAELNLMHPNWIQSITRTGFGTSEASGGASGISGMGGGGSKAPGDISLYDLLVAALRQRPEFIIVGEVRGGEAFTLFQAIAVGHAALGTIHAGSMDELLARVESNPMNVPRSLLSNLDLVIFPMHIKKGERSMRRIANIVEILELDRDKGDLITNTVFKWVPETDDFKWQGRSFLFDKIKETFGVSKELLNQELEDRTRFINWMQKNNIREYHMVTQMVQQYYRDKDEIIRMMDRVSAG
jgi:flagellar protein FlaI